MTCTCIFYRCLVHVLKWTVTPWTCAFNLLCWRHTSQTQYNVHILSLFCYILYSVINVFKQSWVFICSYLYYHGNPDQYMFTVHLPLDVRDYRYMYKLVYGQPCWVLKKRSFTIKCLGYTHFFKCKLVMPERISSI